MRTQNPSIIFLIPCLVFLFSCNSGNQPAGRQQDQKYQKLDQLEWLAGSWANLSDDGNFYETWTRLNDSVYEAFSYMTIAGDTLFSETVELKIIDNELFYMVSVKDQNEGDAVYFKLVSDDQGAFTFENKAHDFPQRIIYKHPAPDSIHARIEGTINGKFSMQEFPMRRVQK